MARQIGSQYRETLAEAGYTFIRWEGGEEDPKAEAIIADADGKQERWVRCDDSAGWTVEIERIGYEFVHSLRQKDYRK
jgi:hypothetical protein